MSPVIHAEIKSFLYKLPKMIVHEDLYGKAYISYE